MHAEGQARHGQLNGELCAEGCSAWPSAAWGHFGIIVPSLPTCAIRASEDSAPSAEVLVGVPAAAAAPSGPLKLMLPELCCARPATSCSSVVLPAPLLPNTRPSWLGGSDRLTSVSSGVGAPAGCTYTGKLPVMNRLASFWSWTNRQCE